MLRVPVFPKLVQCDHARLTSAARAQHLAMRQPLAVLTEEVLEKRRLVLGAEAALQTKQHVFGVVFHRVYFEGCLNGNLFTTSSRFRFFRYDFLDLCKFA